MENASEVLLKNLGSQRKAARSFNDSQDIYSGSGYPAGIS